MIIVYTGGIGSGKTISAVKSIVKQNRFCYTNFALKNFKNYHRLEFKDLINYDDKGKAQTVNWEFWNNARKEHKDFSIYLDEIHNIISSRRSTSKLNVLASHWVSQIRKILSDSPNNHLVLITQRFYKLDIDFRELAHIIISCRAIHKRGKVYVRHQYFDGDTNYLDGKRSASRVFLANPYFKYYNTLEAVKFGQEHYV